MPGHRIYGKYKFLNSRSLPQAEGRSGLGSRAGLVILASFPGQELAQGPYRCLSTHLGMN